MPLIVVSIIVPPMYPAFYRTAVRSGAKNGLLASFVKLHARATAPVLLCRLHLEANAALRLGKDSVDNRELGAVADDADEDDDGGM